MLFIGAKPRHPPTYRPSFRAFLLVGGAVVLSATPVAAQGTVAQLSLDRTRASVRDDAQLALPDILNGALTARNQSDQPVALVLFVFRLRGERTVARFQSEPFKVGAGRTFRLGDKYLPAPQFYGNDAFNVAKSFLPAKKSVPAKAGVEDPHRFVADGIFAKPPDWEKREAVYLIVVPADARQRADATAYPMVMFYPALPRF